MTTKSGALDALIAEFRTTDVTFFSHGDVERWIKKAYYAGKQVAFGAALGECEGYLRKNIVATPRYDAAIEIAELIDQRAVRERP